MLLDMFKRCTDVIGGQEWQCQKPTHIMMYSVSFHVVGGQAGLLYLAPYSFSPVEHAAFVYDIITENVLP